MQVSKTNRFRLKCQRATLEQLTIIPGCAYPDEAMLAFSQRYRLCACYANGRGNSLNILSEYTTTAVSVGAVNVPQVVISPLGYREAIAQNTAPDAPAMSARVRYAQFGFVGALPLRSSFAGLRPPSSCNAAPLTLRNAQLPEVQQLYRPHIRRLYGLRTNVLLGLLRCFFAIQLICHPAIAINFCNYL
jgi:hypothetical protein